MKPRPPVPHLPIPHDVRASWPGWDSEVAWAHVAEATTWRLKQDEQVRYLKLLQQGCYPTLEEEQVRIEWLKSFLRVPELAGYGTAEGLEWLLLDAVPGLDATKAKHELTIQVLVEALARGLRLFHETLPVASCPFDFRLDAALAHVRRRIEQGKIDPEHHFHPIHSHYTPQRALEWLERNRPESEHLVVCHGDYCLPNIMLEADQVTGYIDLGEVGVADRWWDLAIATWSLEWNLGAGWEGVFLNAYGVQADSRRSAYYRLLYDMVG